MLKKTKEHKKKIKESAQKRWQNPEERKKASERAINEIKKNNHHFTSKLEDYFSNILMELEINFSRHFYAKEIKGFYDFYISINPCHSSQPYRDQRRKVYDPQAASHDPFAKKSP